MDKISARSEIRAYIENNFLLKNANDSEAFGDDTQLMEAGILDSTAAMELVAFLETTFNITIRDDEVIPENLNSVYSISEFVARK